MPLQFVDTLTPDQVPQLHRRYQGEWWTKGRTQAELERIEQHWPIAKELQRIHGSAFICDRSKVSSTERV